MYIKRDTGYTITSWLVLLSLMGSCDERDESAIVVLFARLHNIIFYHMLERLMHAFA